MATKIVKVVSEAYKEYYDRATERLNNINNEIEEEVALYRETVVAKKNDDIKRLEKIVEQCMEEKEVEEEENEEINNEEVENQEVPNETVSNENIYY